MVPFVFSQAEPDLVVPVSPDERRDWQQADHDFFAARGIEVGTGPNAALPTTSPVTKSTETTIPATDSDEGTWTTIDD